METKIAVSSFQSLGTKDGPGVRFVVFLAGCPMRCVWCHNPETQSAEGAELHSVAELFERILRYKSYFGADGGVTFSGGEPLLQAAEITPLLRLLHEEGIHIALDTAGFEPDEHIKEAIEFSDLIMLSIKGFSEMEYQKNASGRFETVPAFLREAQNQQKKVRLRYLLVPGLTDSEEHLRQLTLLEQRFSCIREVEFLGFRKLCLEKYRELNREFPLAEVPEMLPEQLPSYQKRYEALKGRR